MARPRKGHEKHATERMAFRVPPWVRAGIDRLCSEREAALSDIANEAFVAYLKRHGIKQPDKEKFAIATPAATPTPVRRR